MSYSAIVPPTVQNLDADDATLVDSDDDTIVDSEDSDGSEDSLFSDDYWDSQQESPRSDEAEYPTVLAAIWREVSFYFISKAFSDECSKGIS